MMEKIMSNVREFLGYDENDESHDDEIRQTYSKSEIFDMYLKYEGIIGYSYQILLVLEELYDLDFDNLDE